jgi:hypothetical protein
VLRGGGDLLGRRAGLLRRRGDLLGDDREAPALLAGAGRLDRCVQREQVRLLGDWLVIIAPESRYGSIMPSKPFSAGST